MGDRGVSNLEASTGGEIKEYLKTFKAKCKKGYNEVKMALEKPKEESKKEESKGTADRRPSTLDKPVQDLMNFIFDMKMIQESVVNLGYDPSRLPLGQISKETILDGYRILKDIEQVLAGTKKGDLEELSGRFYSRIPHNFGRQKMSNFVIDSDKSLKEKLDLVQNLADIKIAQDMVDEEEKKDKDGGAGVDNRKPSIEDENYQKLNCKVETLVPGSEVYNMVKRYLDNT